MSVELKDGEVELHKGLVETVAELRKVYANFPSDRSSIGKLLEVMGENAHKLHKALKSRGCEPRHHKYMFENRGLPSEHKDFYKHLHPVEDLLAFIEDEHANDDPEDQTIGHKFSMSVYSRRWGHKDNYSITRTETGWYISLTHEGPCDKSGRPFLYANFQNDMVRYPADLEGRLEWLWERASAQGLTHEEVQTVLDQLAEWINLISKNAPSGGIWEGF